MESSWSLAKVVPALRFGRPCGTTYDLEQDDPVDISGIDFPLLMLADRAQMPFLSRPLPPPTRRP